MTSEEARHYLRNKGRSSCSCKYGSIDKMIEEAVRLKEDEENKKTQP
jgi:hypothetical protein